MQAIIRAGGKQHKVTVGDVIEVERIRNGSGTVEFTPLLVIGDDGRVTSDRGELAKLTVSASVLGEGRGGKVQIVKFRSKTGYRRRAGHRQAYTTLQIDAIGRKGRRGGTRTRSGKAADASEDRGEE